MLKGGIQLSLLIGPVAPVPAPPPVIEALIGVEVSIRDTGRSGFQLQFALDIQSPLNTIFLLSGAGPIPLIRCIIMVTLNGSPSVIMDGLVTQQQVTPAGPDGRATLTVTGEDISVAMDQQDFTGFPFPALPMEGRIALLIAKYAVLGIIPKIIPSVMIDIPIPTNHVPSQGGTDLQYINQLAGEVGYVFYIEPGPRPGVNIAYWGPQIKLGVPQPALSFNMGPHTNVEALSFTFDNNKSGLPTLYHYNELSNVPIPIPIPPITPFSPPLGLAPPIPTRLEPVGDSYSKRSLALGMMKGMATAADMQEVVKGQGTLDVLRYGRILKARQLVGVRGAGMAFDGLHYVDSVTHKIKKGEYKQSFTLSRNGLLSTVPKVD